MFIELLSKQEHLVTEFDEKMFNTLVEKMIVYTKDKIEVYFKEQSDHRNIIWLFSVESHIGFMV